jgi:signal transduction histidine kinase
VQCFMNATGGKLEIESAEGQGTTIRLIFPCLSDV